MNTRPLIVLGGLICAVALALSDRAAADTFRVVNVRPGDELNVRAGPSADYPILGTLARGQTGVEWVGECVRRWCPVRDGILLGWASAQFLERESSSPAQTAQPETLAALGTVLDDGTLERTYSDGRRLQRTASGRLRIVHPDGSVTPYQFAQAPGAGLPTLPSELSGWAGSVSGNLLAILRNILTDAEMEAYLQTEAGKELVELLDWRLRSIEFLTAPAS
jgi:uncharacterized protein YraI